ncbi:MAG TPA: TonB-dependent receptor [Desulfocapsa sulfexigens]|nr:TonB-dependent receptor [Desulfocapsa sulfexigens]
MAYAGSQDVIDYESGYPYQDMKLDANIVTDLTASYRFYENERIGALTLRGEIQNLFDEDSAYVKEFPIPGRGFYAGLRWEY